MTQNEDFSSHAFRHTFGQRLKDKGAKDNFIMDWMGHASLKTTKIYVKPGPKNLRRTMPECLKTA
ncbi:tyrosine-type recombinase/integrase [Lacrimispora brassicae]